MRFKIEWIALLPLLLLPVAVGCIHQDDEVGPPSDLTVSSTTNSEIVLSWIDGSDNETEFWLERAPGGTANFTQIVTLPAGTTTHADTGLTTGAQFCYRVRARTPESVSPYSNTACGTTGTSVLAAPTDLAVTSTTASQINLSWTDNSSNEDGFQIEVAPGTTSVFTQIATVGANVTTFSNTGLGAASTFTYRVRAFNAGGNSAYSNTIAGTTGGAAPSAPSNLVLSSRTTTQIVLGWTDNSSNETGFTIERAPGTTSSFSVLVTVGAGVVAFTNGSLSGNQTFTYRVRAFSAGGDSSPSNALTAKTLVSYAGQVHPLFSGTPSCTGCHAGGHPAGELKLNGGASSVFPAVSARVNVGLPCDSLMLKKPSSTNCIGGAVSHDGGTLWSTTGSPYQTMLAWIQEGAANN